jgi:hypothetical protein
MILKKEEKEKTMKTKMILLTALSALVVLFSLTLSFGAKMSRNVSGSNEAAPVASATPLSAPKYKTVSLACSTGVLYTTVKNSSAVNIPSGATITVHGVQGNCTQSAQGPLAKGKSMGFKGCVEPISTCKASAKWELGTE